MQFRGNASVIAGTGSNSTETTINSTKKAKALEWMQHFFVVFPYYTNLLRRGLYQLTKQLQESTKLPADYFTIFRKNRNKHAARNIARAAEFKILSG